jgi:hypothetical protein
MPRQRSFSAWPDRCGTGARGTRPGVVLPAAWRTRQRLSRGRPSWPRDRQPVEINQRPHRVQRCVERDGIAVVVPIHLPVAQPRNFNRYWDRRCDLAGVRRITIRDARRTCASLLADLDVDPGWPCRSSGTPSSRSPWRSTRWCRRQRPARPSRRWASPLIADMPPAAGVPGNAAGAPVHAEFAGLVLDPVRLPRGDEGRLTQLEAAVDPAGQQKSIGGHGLGHSTSQTCAAVLCCCTAPDTELVSAGNPMLTSQYSGPPGTRTLNLRIKSPQPEAFFRRV